MLSNLKEFVKIHQNDIILLIGVILISLLSFAAGYITAKIQEKESIKMEGYEIRKTYEYTKTNERNNIFFVIS